MTTIALSFCLVLYLPLDSHLKLPAGGSALSNAYCILCGQIKGFSSSTATILCQVEVIAASSWPGDSLSSLS